MSKSVKEPEASISLKGASEWSGLKKDDDEKKRGQQSSCCVRGSKSPNRLEEGLIRRSVPPKKSVITFNTDDIPTHRLNLFDAESGRTNGKGFGMVPTYQNDTLQTSTSDGTTMRIIDYAQLPENFKKLVPFPPEAAKLLSVKITKNRPAQKLPIPYAEMIPEIRKDQLEERQRLKKLRRRRRSLIPSPGNFTDAESEKDSEKEIHLPTSAIEKLRAFSFKKLFLDWKTIEKARSWERVGFYILQVFTTLSIVVPFVIDYFVLKDEIGDIKTLFEVHSTFVALRESSMKRRYALRLNVLFEKLNFDGGHDIIVFEERTFKFWKNELFFNQVYANDVSYCENDCAFQLDLEFFKPESDKHKNWRSIVDRHTERLQFFAKELATKLDPSPENDFPYENATYRKILIKEEHRSQKHELELIEEVYAKTDATARFDRIYAYDFLLEIARTEQLAEIYDRSIERYERIDEQEDWRRDWWFKGETVIMLIVITLGTTITSRFAYRSMRLGNRFTANLEIKRIENQRVWYNYLVHLSKQENEKEVEARVDLLQKKASIINPVALLEEAAEQNFFQKIKSKSGGGIRKKIQFDTYEEEAENVKSGCCCCPRRRTRALIRGPQFEAAENAPALSELGWALCTRRRPKDREELKLRERILSKYSGSVVTCVSFIGLILIVFPMVVILFLEAKVLIDNETADQMLDIVQMRESLYFAQASCISSILLSHMAQKETDPNLKRYYINLVAQENRQFWREVTHHDSLNNTILSLRENELASGTDWIRSQKDYSRKWTVQEDYENFSEELKPIVEGWRQAIMSFNGTSLNSPIPHNQIFSLDPTENGLAKFEITLEKLEKINELYLVRTIEDLTFDTYANERYTTVMVGILLLCQIVLMVSFVLFEDRRERYTDTLLNYQDRWKDMALLFWTFDLVYGDDSLAKKNEKIERDSLSDKSLNRYRTRSRKVSAISGLYTESSGSDHKPRSSFRLKSGGKKKKKE